MEEKDSIKDILKADLKDAVKELCSDIEQAGDPKLIQVARDIQDKYASELNEK
jgi:hypothetical protein